MRVLLAGATGIIGHQAVLVLTAAGHQVTGLARTPARLPDAEVVAADALDHTGVARAVRSAAPDVIVHMLTAIPDPPGPAGWCCGWATSTARAPASPPTAASAECSAPATSPRSATVPRCSPSSTPTTSLPRSWPRSTYSGWRDGLTADLGFP